MEYSELWHVLIVISNREHLERNHAQPPSCLRCYKAFKRERDRDIHMRSTERCDVREPPPRTDGFDLSQRDQLKARPKGYKSMSETQKWHHVYLVLFPETEKADVPSPCKWLLAGKAMITTQLTRYRLRIQYSQRPGPSSGSDD
jgi:hypothetical protein